MIHIKLNSLIVQNSLEERMGETENIYEIAFELTFWPGWLP